MITQTELKEQLDYNPKTGVFIWKVSNSKRVKVGDVAGALNDKKYSLIQINSKKYSSHRLAWLYVHGEFPKNEIDHINGNRSDNRIENLRVVTKRQNQQNKKIHREGHLVGTTYHRRNNKWQAQIKINGQYIFLGNYETQQEAHEAYLNNLKVV